MTYANYNRNVIFNYNQSGNNVPGGDITSTVCTILGYSNQCFVWREVENFGNKIQETYETRLWSCAYDMAEPIVAQKIAEEYENTHDKNTWMQIYNLFLSDIASLMGSEKYIEALGNYQRMMAALKDYFGINDIDLSTQNQMTDILSSDGGYFKIKLPAGKVAIGN